MKTIFILGGSGFIGQELVSAAIRQGWQVKALARSVQSADQLRLLNTVPVMGDALDATTWANEVQGADVLIDLVQAALPERLGSREMRNMVELRLRSTRSVLDALQNTPKTNRPLLLSVSGTDDLLPDGARRIDDASPLRKKAYGFGQIGIPVRKLIENSNIETVYIHLAHVYGPGKFFRKAVPAIARGKFPVIGQGDNHFPLVHVNDAARALLHLTGLPRQKIAGKQFIVADQMPVTLGSFVDIIAKAVDAPHPRHIPRWLAAIAVGKAMASEMAADVIADPQALLNSGFLFTYPSIHDGLPPTLSALGARMNDHV